MTRSFAPLIAVLLLAPSSAWANDGYHPWAHKPQVRTLDLSEAAANPEAHIAAPVEQPDFWNLDAHALPADERTDEIPPSRAAGDEARMPEGWVQRGNVVLPAPVANGDMQVEPQAIFAVEDIPGNKYPRKHTLFLNFNGGMLYSGLGQLRRGHIHAGAAGHLPHVWRW